MNPLSTVKLCLTCSFTGIWLCVVVIVTCSVVYPHRFLFAISVSWVGTVNFAILSHYMKYLNLSKNPGEWLWSNRNTVLAELLLAQLIQTLNVNTEVADCWSSGNPEPQKQWVDVPEMPFSAMAHGLLQQTACVCVCLHLYLYHNNPLHLSPKVCHLWKWDLHTPVSALSGSTYTHTHSYTLRHRFVLGPAAEEQGG